MVEKEDERAFFFFLFVSYCLGILLETVKKTSHHILRKLADPGGRAVYGVGLQLLDCWYHGFESR